ncbi:SusD/RagB family nutrient-binding outer membrane lipoprotein, partial [Gillisia limnaea]
TGGLYDENTGYSIDATSGTGVAPHRLLTYDEFLYIEAELILEGLIAGSAKDKLEEAMEASFRQVDEVVAGTGTTQEVPVLTGSEEVANYIGAVLASFEGASAERQLEVIITQKWVSTFGDPVDQYADLRRTGYPRIPNPNASGNEYQLDMGDFPLNPNFTVQNNEFPKSLFWPQNELNLNQNAPAQKTPANYTIFWDN